jgi:hypothetical protein
MEAVIGKKKKGAVRQRTALTISSVVFGLFIE